MIPGILFPVRQKIASMFHACAGDAETVVIRFQSSHLNLVKHLSSMELPVEYWQEKLNRPTMAACCAEMQNHMKQEEVLIIWARRATRRTAQFFNANPINDYEHKNHIDS